MGPFSPRVESTTIKMQARFPLYRMHVEGYEIEEGCVVIDTHEGKLVIDTHQVQDAFHKSLDVISINNGRYIHDVKMRSMVEAAQVRILVPSLHKNLTPQKAVFDINRLIPKEDPVAEALQFMKEMGLGEPSPGMVKMMRAGMHPHVRVIDEPPPLDAPFSFRAPSVTPGETEGGTETPGEDAVDAVMVEKEV